MLSRNKSMGFIKYHHVERYGMDEVQDIELGECYVFPKIDGTCSSVWWMDNSVDPMPACGSRNRALTAISDNAGFYKWAMDDKNIWDILRENETWHIYGEWLVPHTLKTYRDEAWRRFWVFDVFCTEKQKLLPFDVYSEVLEYHKLDYIQPLCIVKDGSEETFRKIVDQNTFLIKDGAGAGEGVVIKNYAWENKYGRQTWAKIVRNEFKEENRKAFGINIVTGKKQVEAEIASMFVTPEFVAKTRAKIELETKERRSLIPRLLQTCYHDLVTEEIWDIIKKHKNLTINFNTLQKHVIYQVKKLSQDLF